MDWTLVEKTPKYNPHCFTMARHLNGWSKKELAERTGFTVKKISAIENGEVEATDGDVKIITQAQRHVIEKFFEQWPETELDISGALCKNIPINYYKFKIFRDCNPSPLASIKKKIPFEMPQAKVVPMAY